MKNVQSVSERNSGRAIMALFLFLLLAIASCVKCFGQSGAVSAANAGYYAGADIAPAEYISILPDSTECTQLSQKEFGPHGYGTLSVSMGKFYYETQTPLPADTTVELRGAFLQGDTCVVSFRTTIATFSGGNLAYLLLPAIGDGSRPIMNFETIRGECLSDNCDTFFYDTDRGRVSVRIDGGYFINVVNQHFSLNLFPATIDSYTIIK